jgi:hypothetical protein
MFTINIYLRFALIGLTIIGGAILSLFTSFWYALPLFLVGITLLVGYILLGTVQTAAIFMEKMDFAGAEKRLNLTWKPQWMYNVNRAYYFLLKGTIAMQKKDNDAAEKYFHIAKDLKLPGENEKAMVHLNLSNLAAARGNWNLAKVEMSTAKKFKVTDSNLKDQMRQYEKALSQSGTVRKHGMTAGKQMGGKRKRPKMR